jgi:hypothetical protein
MICEEFDLMNLKFDLHAWCIMAFYRPLQIIGLWMIFLFLIFQTFENFMYLEQDSFRSIIYPETSCELNWYNV